MHAPQLVRAMKTVGFFDVKVVDYKARWDTSQAKTLPAVNPYLVINFSFFAECIPSWTNYKSVLLQSYKIITVMVNWSWNTLFIFLSIRPAIILTSFLVCMALAWLTSSSYQTGQLLLKCKLHVHAWLSNFFYNIIWWSMIEICVHVFSLYSIVTILRIQGVITTWQDYGKQKLSRFDNNHQLLLNVS